MSNNKSNHTGPFLIMVGLMFIVGFLTVVNQQFQTPLQEALLSNAGTLKNTLATLITFAFFMGYPALGSTASKWADTIGYKGTLVRGLLVLIVGLGIEALSAYVSNTGTVEINGAAIPVAFFIFLLGSFVLGSALAILQTVINPFLLVTEVPGTSAVTRANIGGSLNSIGTTIAPFFVAYVVFGGSTPEVAQLLLPLSILILVVGVLTGVVKKLHLPTPNVGGDEEVDISKLTRSIWSFNHLKLGVVGIFVYVGVEVAVGSNITLYAKSLGFDKELYATMTALYWGGMLVGRLFGSFLSKIAAQKQLLFTATVSLILVIISMATDNPWFLVGIGLMHSIMWGAIFALAIDKLGAYTAKGSGALMIGVAGGAIIPWLQGVAADMIGGWELTWIIVAVCEVYLIYYAVAGHKIKE
ncbi:MAG: MFS transporter [Chlamydiia bacterium]|nr:MFS transporter [Chlamydiia bacterium]